MRLIPLHNNMLKVYSKSETYPVSVAELKTHLHVDGTDYDTEFAAFIARAVSELEQLTDRTLTDTTYDLCLDGFRRKIWLPKPCQSSVTSVKYYDHENVLQTLAADEYFVMISSYSQSFIEFPTWPSTYCRPDAVTIRFVAAHTGIPAAAKGIILQMCGLYHFDRETQQMDFTALNRAINSIRHEGYPCQ